MSDNLPPGITLSPGGGCTIDLRGVFNRTSGATEPRLAVSPAPQVAPAVAAPAGAAVAAPAPVRLVVSGTDRGLNDGRLGVSGGNREQMEDRANRAIAAGQLTPAGAAQMLAQEGFGTYSPDGRTAPQAAHDAAHDMPAGGHRPDDYAGRIRLPDARELTPAEFSSAIGEVNAALAGLNVPVRMAQSVVDMIDQADMAVTACPTPEARQALYDKWQSNLAALLGDDAFGEGRWGPLKALTDKLPDNAVIRHAISAGLLRYPPLAVALLTRAAAVASRPK